MSGERRRSKGDAHPTRAGKRAEQPKPTARKGVVSRVRKGDLDRVTAYLPVELGTQLRMACAAQRMELSEAIAEALRDWLAEQDS